jgi:SAM-dependent methyltransferase
MRSYKKVLIDLYGAELTKKRATWLDIGCGHGEFLMALEEFSNGNVTAKGIEPNDNKQASARERKLDVSFFDIKSHKQKYDVISLLNVYSHLPDPPEFLNYCRNIINTGGELVLQTGDSAHLSAKELYRPLCLPVHLSIASESIIRGILTRVGFEVLFVYKYFVIQPNIISLIKELIKIVWPNKTSMLRYLWNPKYRTDMFIRAKKNSTHHG